MLGPGGQAKQAAAARARLDDRIARGHRRVREPRARPSTTRRTARPRRRPTPTSATLTAARGASEDPDAALVAWYATHHLLGLRGAVTELYAQHKAAWTRSIASPGKLGWRAAAELVEWSIAEAFDAAEATGDAYDALA